MRRACYILLFCFSLEVFASFSVFIQPAFASANVITTHSVAFTFQEEKEQWSGNAEQMRGIARWPGKISAKTEYPVAKRFQQSVKKFWPSINIPNIFSLWQQQPDKHQQKDAADYGV